MLGLWLFFGIFIGGIGVVLAARSFARGAAEMEQQESHRLTWE